jgi:hypothetical protein
MRPDLDEPATILQTQRAGPEGIAAVFSGEQWTPDKGRSPLMNATIRVAALFGFALAFDNATHAFLYNS